MAPTWHKARNRGPQRDDARTGHKRQYRVPTAYATETDYWQQERASCSFEKGRPDRFCASKHARTADCAAQDCLQQNPALKATLRRASSNESLPKQSGDQDLPPTTSTSPSTPVTRSPHALSDERPAQQESAESQTPSTSSPNEQELKQLKQQLDRHDRTLKRHDEIVEERER